MPAYAEHHALDSCVGPRAKTEILLGDMPGHSQVDWGMESRLCSVLAAQHQLKTVMQR